MADTAALSIVVRRAVVSDIPKIQGLIDTFACKDEMLHRSLNELFENMRDFHVAEDESGDIVACAAIHVYWDDLGELKCVAVSPKVQGRGYGKLIVESCLDDARALGLRRVFALTYKPEFFGRYGFVVVERNTLPHKVWGECIKCHKFPDCHEVAMMNYVQRGPSPAIEE